MKKALVFLLTLAMLITPLAAFATDVALGEYDNPYQLSATSVRFAVYVEPEATAWVQVDNCNNSVVEVGYATGSDYMVVYCRQPVYPETDSGDNTLSFTMVDGADMFSVYNSGSEAVTVYMALTEGAPVDNSGTMDNPEEVVLTEGWFGISGYAEKELEAGNQGRWYKCIAPADGLLAVNVDAHDAEWNPVGWMYNVNNMTSGIYGDTHWSDEEEPVYYEEVSVNAGDEVVVFITTYDPMNMWVSPAGFVSVNFSFSPVGTWGNPEVISAGTYAANLASGSQGYYYSWTAAETGTATIAMDSASGWMYSVNGEMTDGSFIYGDTHWCDDDPVVASESIAVNAGDILTISVNTYDPADPWSAPAGTVNWTLSFTAGAAGGDDGEGGDDIGGGDIGGGDDEEEVNYAYSDTYLEVGTNAYVLDAGYPYTIFTFEPTETGKYIISADALVGIVSYNGMWVSVDPSAETVAANSVEWDCTGVGQSIWVAVFADTNIANITVEKEELVIKEIEKIEYENVVTPEEFIFEGDANELVYVDTEDDIADVAVLGEDGYYHLNSATGPILYANLNDSIMPLLDAYGYGQIKDVIYDEEGDAIAVVDYNSAYMEYFSNAFYVETEENDMYLYPLTEDIMAIYQNVGANNGWYGEEGWVGGTEEDAWMFACYYFEGETHEPGSDNEEPGENEPGEEDEGSKEDAPQTGDNAVFMLVVAFVALMGCAVVLFVRKRNTAK